MANLNNRIMSAIRGAAYVECSGLADYFATQAVKSALRRKNASERLSGCREALKQYRVTAWLTDDERIELRRDGTAVEVLT